ncbi:MAG: DNA/RNA nuclease SfsA [Oscillospiraceae bacterium]|nr:DNA/RNA nuclease SfsA [Oscillospiraceae bacterium]
MQYSRVYPARFLNRPNRFVAQVLLEGEAVVVHVKNTGRCRELLLEGAHVYLTDGKHDKRKTQYDLIAVEKERSGQAPLLVNLDAQAPNRVFQEWAASGQFQSDLTLLRPEQTWGHSRFDFYWEAGSPYNLRRGFVEVKGVTLEENSHARFPDAPTERGLKHVEELIACRADGYEAALCFVIQMEGMKQFSPNDNTHPAFGEALRRAVQAGVQVFARGCIVTPERLELAEPVKLEL